MEKDKKVSGKRGKKSKYIRRCRMFEHVCHRWQVQSGGEKLIVKRYFHLASVYLFHGSLRSVGGRTCSFL